MKMDSSLPELSHVNDDVDLDKLDFEVLPWLKTLAKSTITKFRTDPKYANCVT